MEKILIVDDKLVNRKLLHNILKDGYEIMEAASGEEALSILFDESQDILAVFLDIVMPGMDGFEVLKKIRNNTRISDIPVIIHTASAEESFEMNALKAGATDFVSKPYKPEIIKTRLQNVINTRIMLNEISCLSSDELTGLMSMNQFYYEGAKWISQNQDSQFDIVALDIVHFGIINDSKGVDGGNEILKTIADRIKKIQKEVMFLASRVYADRFILLIRRREGYCDRLVEEADCISKKYAATMSVHIKFGIYEITEKNVKLSTLCGRAFSATNLIKDFYGNGYAYYDEKLHNQILYEQHINDEMETALKEQQFQIYFQPKYDLFTKSIAGAEALIRWKHPTDGMVSPGAFIPIFEKNGFIVQLDQYVWDHTASQIAEWYHEGKKVVPVSVNISRVDIEMMDVISVLDGIVNKYHLDPELLHLEITESAYMQDIDKIIDVVSQLKNKGFMIEMDDFGSGYSSLNMLAKLPINILKLDMKFIQELESSANAKTIIEYTIGLAKWMNLPVVAEGVETDEQLDLLRKLECNYVQGYVFSKPIPEDQFKQLLVSSEPDSIAENRKNQELFIYSSKKNYRMLIIDDLQLNRSIIRSYFEDSFSIIEAVNGKVAMEYLESGEKVDIIMLDIYMPELNGYQLLEKIKADPALKKIPVLVISSGTNDEEQKKALELGADGFAAKPFTAENIINKVRILLRSVNALEEMNIWDLKDTLSNPWMKDVCDEIAVIRVKTGKICRIEHEVLVDTEKDFSSLMPEDTFQKCLEHIQISGKRFEAYKENDFVINAHSFWMNKEQYVLCFKVLIVNAVQLK